MLKSGEEKIKGLKGKLNAAASNREYQAIKDQIAADEMANSVLADETLEALEKIDELQGMVAEAQKKIAVAKEELAKVQETVRKESQGLDAEIQRLENELKEAEARIPDRLQERLLPRGQVEGGRRHGRSAKRVLRRLLSTAHAQ